HDGGDAETGFGVDLGGGIEWSDPKRGISLDISGRTLFPVFGERFMATPRLGYGLFGTARDYSLGWSLKPTGDGPDLSLHVLSTRRENGRAAPEHGFRIEGEARW
ncbi:MAG: hypothetical protein OXU77_18630, partial [Gammaproteobacteria bacterium]|nr:hypothetical protein [Gammaproteobacteria bacterium]